MSEEERGEPAPAVHVEGPAALGGDVTMTGTNVAGRDLVTNVRTFVAIWTGERRSGPTPAEQRRARTALLAEMRRHWVEGELDRSLGTVARMELGLAERPGAVSNQLRAILRRPDEPDRPLPRGTSIRRVFQQLGGQMLILGSPGAGKTTLLLELARSLLDEAGPQPDAPMPVVLHLSTWAIARRPLRDWITDELERRYGVARRLARFWLDTQQLALLLDGLDEVTGDQRNACVAAVNRFHRELGQIPLAVCSRVEEYEALRAQLELRGAVVVQPLSRADVEGYLAEGGEPLAGVREMLRQDGRLWDLLTTPLFLSIVTLAYRGRPAAEVAGGGTTRERQRQVLADYVQAMLARPRSATGPVYDDERTVAWLSWLAATMRARGQTVFSPDWMQPDLLAGRAQRWLTTWGMTLGAGVLWGAAAGVAAALLPPVDPGRALAFGPLAGIAAAAAAGRSDIVPSARLRWSWAGLRADLLSWLAGALVAALAAVVLGTELKAPRDLVWGALVGVTAMALLLSGLGAPLDVTPTAPGAGVRRLLANALVTGLATAAGVAGIVFAFVFTGIALPTIGALLGVCAGLGILLTVGVGGEEMRPLTRTVLAAAGAGAGAVGALVLFLTLLFPLGQLITNFSLLGLAVGVAFLGVAAGAPVLLRRGGAAYLRHRTLRRLLSLDGVAPADYVRFLDHACRLVLLRRRGGSYEFVHRLVLEHFADAYRQERPAGPRAEVRVVVRDAHEAPAAETSITAAFARLSGQLVLLGQPGAGKTAQLFELSDALRDEMASRPDRRLPLVFPLAGWALEHRPLRHWLVQELHRRYRVTQPLARAWLDSGQVIPLLDGLDEVASERRGACVEAINRFHLQNPALPLVVSCRTSEFEALTARIELPVAEILPVGPTPRFFGMMVRASAAAQGGESPERTVGDYVRAALAGSSSPEQTAAGMRWLASAIRARGQLVFAPDWLQPDWLARRRERLLACWLPVLAVGLVAGVIAAVAVAIGRPEPPNPGRGLAFGAVLALGAAAAARGRDIVPAGRLGWSWAALRGRLWAWVPSLLVLVVGLLPILLTPVAPMAILGLTAIVVSAGGLGAPPAPGPTAPGDGVRRALTNAWIAGSVMAALAVLLALAGWLAQNVNMTFGSFVGLGAGAGALAAGPARPAGARPWTLVWRAAAGTAAGGVAAFFLYPGPTLTAIGRVAQPLSFLAFTLPFGLIVFLRQGGGTYLRHRALLWLLARDGRAPRDLHAFLREATRRGLLRRRGGAYELFDPLLLGHFAGDGEPSADGSPAAR
jgi:GTPase SAR1 family protein